MKVIAYKNVFNRNEIFETDFETFTENPKLIDNHFTDEKDTFPSMCNQVKRISEKQERNEFKRCIFPAVDLSQSGILSIDIDNISDNEVLKNNIIFKLTQVDSCYLVQESLSGNLVAYFKYDCSVKDYPFVYYKLYLELTLLLGVSIDFLPEIGRLRYLTNGTIYHKNEDSETLTERIEHIEVLPYVKTSMSPKEARGKKFGSN